ncbi:MAG TPA: hypothetical protein VN132_05835 [Bdellovibrio sp.]|nr:hypothetical protein [Bdellovibrio sp.]
MFNRKSLALLVLPVSSLMTFWMTPTAAQANSTKPVSISYENLLRCFPELKDDSLSFKVDLNHLKEVMDEKFVTSQSQLRQRKIRYENSDKQLMNLILRNTFRGDKKIRTELTLQMVDDKGVVTDAKLTDNQRVNPKQEVINSLLLNATIKADEFSYIDTKLNEMISTYRRNFKDIQEIDLNDKLNRREVSCEKQADLGIICTCSKK